MRSSKHSLRQALSIVLLCALASQAAAVIVEGDPVQSPSWDSMHERFLAGEPYVFDDAVKVFAPDYAEDSLNVPVAFDASAISGVRQIVVLADLNPLPMVLRFTPLDVDPSLAFRFKLQQGSPVRVAVLGEDDIWHVGSTWINAAGGGCTAPSVGMASGNWTDTIGDVSAKVFPRAEGNRLKLRVMHPMDTGLADGIPRFHLEVMTLRDAHSGDVIAEIELFEPISENPLLSFDVGDHDAFTLDGSDNNANTVSADIR